MCSSESGGLVGAFSGASDDLNSGTQNFDTNLHSSSDCRTFESQISLETFVLEMRCDGVFLVTPQIL